MEFLFDGLEMEKRKLSVSTNGRLSGYIYSLNCLGIFSAFLFLEKSTLNLKNNF